MDAADKRRMDELMPWYVTGQLDEPDRAWLERLLRQHPSARADLEWHRALQGTIRERVDSLPQDVGLQRLMTRVRAEKAPAAGSWLTRLREAWAGLAARPAFVTAAAAVILAQAVVIGTLLVRDDAGLDYGATRSVAPQLALMEPVLQVTFKAETTERNMRLLLVRVAGRVIDGPGQLGDYIVAVPTDRIEPAKRELEESGLVEQVSVLDRPPARN